MKNIILIALLFIVAQVSAQKFYSTVAGEMILSLADINSGDQPQPQNIVRFSPWFNVQMLGNTDVSDYFGIFYGLNVRNVGYIASDDNLQVKKKYRVYDLGIPIVIKLGNLNRMFVYAGYELEFPFNYKEKTFENEVKTGNFNPWFSDRVPTFYNAVFVGVQFPYGANLKFKYYLTPFHNTDFVEMHDGVEMKPYEHLDTHVFYLALSFTMFRNSSIYYKYERSYH